MILEEIFNEFDLTDSPFNEKESQLFDHYFEKTLIKRNTFIIREGEEEKYSYFIYKGILRCWVPDQNGNERTFWFCKEGSFSLSNIAFTLKEKSTFNVQTLVDCEVYRIDHKTARELYEAIPGLKTVFENLTARLLDRLLKRNIDLIKYDSKQYYLNMIDEFGVTLNYIPLKDVASYLGITPQALSRIRKRIF
ncbi:cAMP-binding domain of CRP or a regulatory subunit of cAMP-dependent protein kinases [Pedobacter caeni]|uniref:cAMP-binding domain of CRP or a regulatory subunit of cAMP-dependent protein kinases n=2 Tax=Pedobacter caeni TaxID=288992 RepID=A0A1M5BGZ0_9SPHI|nr:cAMP-binding domain of CRP or a regulatory subunit of cAMP-dependent protein kinases [Pedobacter caeni]